MFIPDYMYDTVYDIPFEILEKEGIKYIFVDIDNTLVSYEESIPTDENVRWFDKLKSMGIKVFLISNNLSSRVEKYAEGLDIPYVFDAGKPLVKKHKKLIADYGIDVKKCACIGDQIFTDVLSADIIGAKSILVLPIKDLTTMFNKFKRFMEKPFVRAYKKRENKLAINPQNSERVEK